MALLPFVSTAPLQQLTPLSFPIPSSASATFNFLSLRPCCRWTRVRTPCRYLPLLNRIQNASPSFFLRASPSPSSFTDSEVESLSKVESLSEVEPESVSGEFNPQEPVSVESGGGDRFGGGDNFGGGGGGGGDEGEGKEEEPEQEKKNMAMTMSQKLTLGYAALVGLGGLMGYLKSGSTKSLISGGLSALLLYYVHSQLPTNPVFASSVGLGVSAVLLIVMGARFKNSGKVFPAGVVSLVSLIMSGGYIHGILRSSHA